MLGNAPIKVDKVNKAFGSNKVLQNTSFEIKDGEIYGLVGLNGIGKTTIIKIILGLLRHDSGNVQIFGQHNLNREAKREFIYLPEKFTPSQFLKGHEFLTISQNFYNKNLDYKLAKEYCTRLEFNPAFLSKKISSYSKGM